MCARNPVADVILGNICGLNDKAPFKVYESCANKGKRANTDSCKSADDEKIQIHV